MQWFALTLLKEEPWRYNTGEQSGSSALDRLPHSWATEPVRPGWRAGGLEGVGRGSGKLGREGPLAEGSILDAAREIFCGHTHTHTHMETRILYTLLFSPGDRSSFLFHTLSGANINTPTLCLICVGSTSPAVEARNLPAFRVRKPAICWRKHRWTSCLMKNDSLRSGAAEVTERICYVSLQLLSLRKHTLTGIHNVNHPTWGSRPFKGSV